MGGPPGGVLDVSGSQSLAGPDEGLEIDVADSGPGVPPQLRERLMTPFFTTKSMERGTGLGLSIVQEVVLERGGRLAAGSSEEGGALLVIVLPHADTFTPAGTRATVTTTQLDGVLTVGQQYWIGVTAPSANVGNYTVKYVDVNATVYSFDNLHDA